MSTQSNTRIHSISGTVAVIFALFLAYCYYSEGMISHSFNINTAISATNISDSKVYEIDNEETLSICDQDELLCRSIKHPICKYLFPYPIFQVHHHKTGWLLRANIRHHIKEFCNATLKDIDHRFFVDLNPKQRPVSIQNATLFHYMRGPVETILSGFYYHIKVNWHKEPWTAKPIRTARLAHNRVTNQNLFTDLILSRADGTNLYRKYMKITSRQIKYCLTVPANNKDLHSFYLRGIINSNHTNKWSPGESVKQLYKRMVQNNAKHIGFWWEFIRYFNCEWPYQYLVHQIGIKYFHHFYAFDMNDWVTHKGFELNVNRLLNALNIVSTEANIQKLARYGANFSALYIDEERAKLWQTLQIEDHSQRSPPKKARDHITTGSFNTTRSGALLLTLDGSVCNTLKNMTIWLDFEWNYSQFC